jgi:hypothetical protein
MKIRTLVMALAAFSFMLTACENKQANQEQKAENQTETVVEEQPEEAYMDDPIGIVRSVWELAPIPVIPAEGMADIERFALTFCNEYSTYEPNKVLYDYLKDQAKFKEDLERIGYGFNVDNQKEEGYILCRAETQFSNDTDCRCWKRDNGHTLVAFWMEEAHESGDGDELLVFYDYDPATNTMTPELGLVKKVAEAMAQYDGGYTVRLQEQEIIGHKINVEEDNCENTVYSIRWNGNDFSLEKTEE